MNEHQMRAGLVQLHTEMVERLGRQPSIGSTIFIHQIDRVSLNLYLESGFECVSVWSETVEGCLDRAFDIIRKLPTPEVRAVNSYIEMLAKAIDHAKDNNISDEFVDPARVAIKAMTDNLLTLQVKP